MPVIVPTKEDTDNIISTTDAALKNVNTTLQNQINALEARITKLETPVVTPPPPTPTPTPTPTNLYDDFKYTETFQVGKTSSNGKWLLQYTSNGYAKTDGNGAILAPGGTELSIYSGSVLVRSTKKFTNARITFYITNEKQLYTKDANGNTITPPGWHAPWPFGRYVDKWRHWYVIIGRDKVEMGKKDAPTNITDPVVPPVKAPPIDEPLAMTKLSRVSNAF